MNNGYWQSVPIECIEEWKSIFRNNMEGAHLSENCPVCQNKGLHRYYQMGRRMEAITGSNQYIARGAEWQWCSFCKSYEHQQVLVPAWWVPCVEIDGNKLTAIPEILDMAYQDEKRVNKWNRVPEQYVRLWNVIFSQNQEVVILKDKCPICNQKKLLQYYTLDIPKPIKYKKKWYQGQGAHWEWCAACFHYQFDNLAYVPPDWDYELDVEPWEFMAIPEPLNEKMKYSHKNSRGESMKKEDAKQILSFHANKNQDKSFLNFLKQGYMVPDTCFDEIVDAMKCLGESVCCDNMDGETIRDYYTIIFQCRSWLSKDGLLRNEKLGGKLAEEDADLLVKYVEIMENILYYLILGNPDDAFFPYEEFLDGRYY